MVMIFVKLFSGYTQTLYVEPSDSIDSIKDLLYCNCGMPLDLQRLVFAGELLEDGKALFDYDIQNENTILLVLRPVD